MTHHTLVVSRFYRRMAAKMKRQLLKDIAALTSFGDGGGANGEEDVYDDGTSAFGHGKGKEERNGSSAGGVWRVEDDEEREGGLGGVAVSRSRLRMERAMDFGEEEARYRGKKVSRRALLADDNEEDEEEEEGREVGDEKEAD